MHGGPELAAKLRRLSDDMAGQALEDAATAGALLVQNEAKRKAPWRTGNLRRSIHVGGHTEKSEVGSAAKSDLVEVLTKTGKHYKTRRYKGSTGTDIGGNEHSRTRAKVLVGTNVEYARRIEYGFSGTDSLGRHYNQPAHPYLRPAFDEKAAAVVKAVGVALRKLLEHVR